MPAIYNRCDILLNGTRVDNFPASLLEASASGLPIVSTNAGGIPFIYEDGKNAILVDPGDWQGLAAGVERLLNSPSLARQLAEEAAHLCRQCEWQNVRRLLYRSYDFDVPEL
jgi:glycosyltransferase involved in cell wall biosynthesis